MEILDTIDDASSFSAAALRAVQAHLFVALEADNPAARGARVSLAGIDEVIIGRGSERRIERRIEDARYKLYLYVPGRSMSSTHARIVRAGARWVLEDAGSRNGTYLDGVRVTREVMRDGAVAEMGHTFLVLRDALPTPHDAPLDFDARDVMHAPFGLRTLDPSRKQRHDALLRIAASIVPVLLLGPTGTGKELVARAVHAASKRTGAFVPVNCGALPASLVEGLLFGHTRGAFSGAVRDELGFVRAADGGTLFLDEIGDLPAASQAVLLRVLQESEVVPVGATRPIRVDVRVIAATHHPIDKLAAHGGFRSDLLGRLKGFTHVLSPLRERREDMGVLVADLLERLPAPAGAAAPSGSSASQPNSAATAAAVALSTRVARAFLHYAWPLNIRELAQCLSASVTLATGGIISPQHLPAELSELAQGDEITGVAALATSAERASTAPPPPVGIDDDDVHLESVLVASLREHRGNVAAVARAMAKAPMQIHRWMKRFKIDPNDFRA